MSTKRQRILFFGVMSLFSMAANFAHPVTPTLFKMLNFPDHLFGYALGTMMVAYFLFSPFWGRLNSYLSSRTSMIIGSLGYALAQYLFATAQGVPQILVARIVAGIFSAGTFISMINYLVNISPDPRTRGIWLTALSTVQSVAGAFGFFIGGMLGGLNVYYALFGQVILLIVCAALFYFVCEYDLKGEPEKMNVRTLARAANPFKAFVEGGKFMTLSMCLLFGMCALQNLAQTAFDQSLNYYITDQFNFSPAYNGAVKGIMGLVTLVANSTLAVYIMNRRGKSKSVAILLGLCALIMAGTLCTTAFVPFIILNVALFALCSVSLPLMQDMVADQTVNRDSNLVMGFYSGMRSLGGIVGAMGSGTLYAIGPKMPFVSAAIAFGLAAVIGWRYIKFAPDENR